MADLGGKGVSIETPFANPANSMGGSEEGRATGAIAPSSVAKP